VINPESKRFKSDYNKEITGNPVHRKQLNHEGEEDAERNSALISFSWFLL